MNQIIQIPVNPLLTPRQQIDSTLAALAPHYCERHPHVRLELDRPTTICEFLTNEWPKTERWKFPKTSILHSHPCRHRYTFVLVWNRCSGCPYDLGGEPLRRNLGNSESPCAASGDHTLQRLREADDPLPLPAVIEVIEPDLDLTAEQQFQTWLTKAKSLTCAYASDPITLTRLRHKLIPHFSNYHVSPTYSPCPQCWLERKGISPDEAFASFENFIVEPPTIAAHLETCRRFAYKPQGVLLMIGSTGNGKTHLALAIMRERFRRGFSDSIFIKQRHFLDRHWQDKRPISFDEEKPKSILEKCQQTGLLIFDELREATSNRDIEDPLLDLFEYRIGYHLPTVITANVKKSELETAIGSRLLDRLTKANFALAEFNFPSRRAILNADYLARCAPQTRPTP